MVKQIVVKCSMGHMFCFNADLLLLVIFWG